MTDINELDVNDIGLQSVMGNRFQDLSKVKTEKATPNTTPSKKTAQKSNEKALDAEYEPIPDLISKLKSATKRVGSFAVLNLLIFYWQQQGLMAESIALPSMIACAVMAGYGFAKLGDKQ